MARNWSDTAKFLVEAEVVHVMQNQIDHQSYPVIFGPALNFTLPANAEGGTLQADISGETIIFRLVCLGRLRRERKRGSDARREEIQDRHGLLHHGPDRLP